MTEARARQDRTRSAILKVSLLCVLIAAGVACSTRQDQIHLIVAVPARAMSKLPFVIATDQGLYEKHGLDVELWLGPPNPERGVKTYLRFWTSVWMLLGLREAPETDLIIDGHTPQIVSHMRNPEEPRQIALAATDCAMHYSFIARSEIKSLDDLKGKRLGLNSDLSTIGFTGLWMIQKMGWDRDRDISIVAPAGMEALRNGDVDAIVSGDAELSHARQEGFTILDDARGWAEQLSGNSVMVTAEWWQDAGNREAARRFLVATGEAVALFHQRPELAVEVLVKWYGMDRETAEAQYKRTDFIPRKPFPCVEGVRNTVQLYDSEEMRRYKPEDFYDDSFMREMDQSGFLDGLYQ
jgi:ABC-type nitrate/sulfonate/bicarbonate transport system substrate-binding protein